MPKIRTALRPHSADTDVLSKSAKVYARDRTPEITHDGSLAVLDLRPGGPHVAARHVREIHASFGEEGVRQTFHGLQATRGNQFVLQMLAVDPGLQGLVRHDLSAHRVPTDVLVALRSGHAGVGLPADVRGQFEEATGYDVGDVRLMDDGASHDASAAVGARAFTVGQRIFFGRGEYDPHTESGRETIFHELFHTVQQQGAVMPAADSLTISSPHDSVERQAHTAARSVTLRFRSGTTANDTDKILESARGEDPMTMTSLGVGGLQRVITFTTAEGTFTPNNVVANEDATGFTLGSPVPTFQWEPDVTIHGNAGDAFADWETAHHQTGKGDWLNVAWGTGANRTTRHQTVTGGLPIRDATAAGNTWYSDFRAQGFAADGDVRTPLFRDTPSERIPWDNPIPGRVGTRGWFNFGLGFVVTLSARHIPGGTGAAAFRHLNHVHWNFGVSGSWDTTPAVGARVTMTGGAVNRSGMIAGIDANNPPMHGGPIFGDNLVNTDT